MRIKKFNETNGPAYGKEETTKRGLKFMPLTTDNPMIIDPKPADDENDENDSIDDKTTSIEMDDPQPVLDRKKKEKIRKRIKTFKEIYENIGPALDGDYSGSIEDLKKQGEPLRDDKIIDLDSDVYQDQSTNGKESYEVYYTDKDDNEGKVIVWVNDIDEVEEHFEEFYPQFTLYDIGETENN